MIRLWDEDALVLWNIEDILRLRKTQLFHVKQFYARANFWI